MLGKKKNILQLKIGGWGEGGGLHRFHNPFGVVSHQIVKISSTRVILIFSTGINQCHSSLVFLGYYKNTKIMLHNFWNQVIFASLEPLGFNSFTAYFEIFFSLQPKSLVSFTVTKVFLHNYSDSSHSKSSSCCIIWITMF